MDYAHIESGADAPGIKDPVGGGEYMFHIYTLGRFEIYSEGVRITESSKRSIRIWNLFKYILANRKKMLSASELIDVVWGEDACENPEKALQNLIYRLRHSLSQNVKADDLILFNQGCYKWNENFKVWVDCDALTEYSERGKNLIESSPYDAKQCFEKVVELYNGDFLTDIIYDIWVLPVRTMYKKIYSDSILAYLEILDKADDHESVVKVCNNFFNHEFFDEKSNMYFLRALISLNRKQEAQKHYDIMADIMYRDLGVNPSYTFVNILKNMQESPAKIDSKQIDLELINDILWQDEKVSGAFQCDKETFVSISKIMLRNLERSGLSIMLVLVTFSEPAQPGPGASDGPKPPAGRSNLPVKSADASYLIDEAGAGYAHAFRRGDVVCQWNPKQMLIMLTNLTFEDAHIAMKRINQKIQNEILKEHYAVNYKIIPLSHEIL